MHRSIFAALAALPMLAACQPPAVPQASVPTRPSFELATDAAYDFSAIQPYGGGHQAEKS